MKKIIFIIPPSPFLMDERVFVSLGVLKVAGYLEKCNYQVEVIDLSGIVDYEKKIISYFKDINTQDYIIGITATTPQMPSVHKIVNIIKNINNKFIVVLGGPHPTLISAAMKQEKKNNTEGRATIAFNKLLEEYDCIIAGDGELAILEFLKDTSIRFIDSDDINSKLFMTNDFYDKTPYPSRHLIDMKSYHYLIDGVDSTSIIAQLGCPFECGFCGGRNSPMLRKIRVRTIESIISEIEFLYNTYGYKGFMFYDDELNVNPKLVELMSEIIKLQNKLGVEFKLRGFVKSELFNEKQAEIMYKAGFRWLLTGFESGSERILKNMNKKATVDSNFKAVEISRKYGLKVKALMSIGHPGESVDTINETKKWLLDIKPDEFDVTVITPYPGSPYYDESVKTSENVWTYTYKKTGDRLHSSQIDYNEVSDYYKGIIGEYKSYTWTDFLTSDDIVFLRDELEKDVKEGLKISTIKTESSSIVYEHSMGQNIN